MKCIVCGAEFEGRQDAVYCSGACRAKANRTAKRTDAKRTVQNVTDNRAHNNHDLTDVSGNVFKRSWSTAAGCYVVYKTMAELRQAQAVKIA